MTDPTQPEQNPRQQRWHDSPKPLSTSIQLLETFPPDFQIILGETIIKLAEKHCQADEVMANLRSLGPEKVLNIFKSKNKQRSYDRYPTVHQAMNYMYILPDEQRLLMASHIIKVVTHLFDYFKICKAQGLSPSAVMVTSIGNAYIEGTFTDIQTHLAQHANIPHTPVTAATGQSTASNSTKDIATDANQQPGAEHDEKLAIDKNQGMKIKLDKLD